MKSNDRPPKHELHWFPFYVDDFTGSPSVQRMTDTEVGRFVRLLLLAWGNGTREPTLEPEDLETATPRVRNQFKERGTGFVNEKLSKVWRAQRSRHESAVQRGKKGGRPKATGKLSLSSAQAEGEADTKAKAKQGGMVIRESIDSLPVVPPPEIEDGALAADAPRPLQEPARRVGAMRRLLDVLPPLVRPEPA